MKCPVCDAEAPAGARFCQNCGGKLPPSDESPDSDPPTGAPAAATVTKSAGATALTGRRRVSDVPEETLWEGSYSPKAMLGSAVGAGLVSVVLIVASAVWSPAWPIFLGLVIVVWLVVGARLAAKRLGIHYRLTNQMFYHQHGVVNRVTNRIEAIDIDDITWQQGPFDRLVDVGKIKISSSDRSDPVLWVQGVENVQEVAHLIDKARRAERIRRGVSVESL
jgi:uncharacterized membrane protein YdbT with pleckstrin-like domain